MKKLVIALAVVAMAAASQAAKVDWKLNSKNTFLLQDGSAAKGVNVYLLNTAAADYSTLLEKLASGDAKAADVSGYAAFLGTAATGTTTTGAGKIASATAEKSSIVAGADITGTFLVFDSNTKGDWYYISNTATGKGYDGSDEFPTGTAISFSSTGYSADNWKAVSTPEPTSGLLLLLGVAGLALKRRRA